VHPRNRVIWGLETPIETIKKLAFCDERLNNRSCNLNVRMRLG